MLKSLIDGCKTIGKGFASLNIFPSPCSSIKQDIEKKLGKKIVFDNEEEATKADTDAIRKDFEAVLGKW